MRIDAVFYPNSSLVLVDAPMLPLLSSPIPDFTHPSDHLPMRATFRMRTDYDRGLAVSRAWYTSVAMAVLRVKQREQEALFEQTPRDMRVDSHRLR